MCIHYCSLCGKRVEIERGVSEKESDHYKCCGNENYTLDTGGELVVSWFLKLASEFWGLVHTAHSR